MTDQVQAEYALLYGSPEGDASPMTTDEFARPYGRFFIGYLGTVPVAMGGWRRGGPAGPTDAEIKRMYIRPSYRGRGYSRQILAVLESSALAAGVQRLILETGDQQGPALQLYKSAGYTGIEPFGFYAGVEGSFHFAKLLTSP